MVAGAIRQAFTPPDPKGASEVWRHVADQLRARWPKLGALMDDAEADVLAYMAFPMRHRAKLRSTDEIDGRVLDPGGMVLSRGRPCGEARRVGCKRRRAPHSSLAGLRRSRTPPFAGRAFHRSTKRSQVFSACSASGRS